MDTPCIEWTGSLDRDGYGKRWHEGVCTTAHRIEWILANGPIPDGLDVDHRCFNRACIRLDHLRLLPAGENRGLVLEALKPRCKNNHEYTPENTYERPAGSRGRRDCRQCIRDRVARYKARKKQSA